MKLKQKKYSTLHKKNFFLLKNTVNIGHFFSLSVICILTLPFLLTEGLFMDGAMYSTIANNFANGEGTFWFPAFSGDVHNPFFEHPPFAFYLEGIFNQILGGSYFTSRIYGLFTIFSSTIFIHLIWTNSTRAELKKYSWVAILCWIITPQIFWGATQNILENTLSMFCLGSIYFMIKATKVKLTPSIIFSFLGALFTLLAFLSKGFVGLFPLAFYGILWFTSRNSNNSFSGISLKKTFTHYLHLIISCLFLFFVFIYINDDAVESLTTYINKQVGASIKGELRNDNRFIVLTRLFSELLPIIGLIIIGLIFTRKNSIIKNIGNSSFYIHIFVAISASFPLMVSPKQGAFYIIPSIPYFSLALCLILIHIIKSQPSKPQINNRKINRFFTYFSSVVIIASIVLLINNKGSYNRDGNEIKDIKIISAKFPNSSISLTPELKGNWAHMAYLKRYGNIDIYRQKPKDIVLASKKHLKLKGYVLSELKLNNFNLFIKE